MGQILSGLGGQYGGGSQMQGGGGYGRRPVGGGQNSGGNPNYIGAPRSDGGVNGPNGNWPGYYLGGGGALPNSGPTSDRVNPYPYGGGGSPASDPLGNTLGGTDPKSTFSPRQRTDPHGLPGGTIMPGTLAGGVEATPDPLGPMTMENEGSPTVDPKSQPQNPMRRQRGYGTGDEKYRS